jgi:hypothetical protein
MQLERKLNAGFNVTFTSTDGDPRNFHEMRRAFVLQLGPDTRAAQRHFDGWIEEVDTGRELRFRSTDELLSFLSQCAEETATSCIPLRKVPRVPEA